MKRHRGLIAVNILILALLLLVLLLGWKEATAFGLAILVIMDFLVLIRERQAHSERLEESEDDVDNLWPTITYEQALAVHEAGQKLHLAGHIYLVRPVPREPDEGLVLWVTDETTQGDHGLLLFADGRTETK
jgi:hypothetical protein